MSDQSVEEVVSFVQALRRGPGGAVAVLKDGEVVSQHVWGYADMEKRIPMTPETRMPICSITKQMLCMLMMDLERDPPATAPAPGEFRRQLENRLRQVLRPEMTQDSGLTIQHLCNNQSGIRDYWALTTLWGGRPDGQFCLPDDADKTLERLASFHFQPGTQHSYANTNFHILARLIEDVTQEPLERLLKERIFLPLGMQTAVLAPDTACAPTPCVGYDGNTRSGFVPAVNRIQWSGDSGIVASLSDMIAYERYLHSKWDDPESVYRAMAEPQTFDDGVPALYGNGLSHVKIGGVLTVGHGGALRGFRLHRRHVPSERLSVVVMFNHEEDAEDTAGSILRQLIDRRRESMAMNITPATGWYGIFFDPVDRLTINFSPNSVPGQLKLKYAGCDEVLELVDPYQAQSVTMTATLQNDVVILHRLEDNKVIHARSIDSAVGSSSGPTDYRGEYYCADIDSTFHCTGHGEILYGAFDGFLGQGPVHIMQYLAQDIWSLYCPRGMDAPAPGDWTVAFRRDENGVIDGVTVGCWLARKLEFKKK
ncbi:hypothetical protein MW887_009950 [Aspergillus wentii]|nr:hypothetical protein MW887_009950 [Aspergillus wentii]